MNSKSFADSELVVNLDGSIYHLRLKPENVADTVILVGDPGRVKAVSSHFDIVHDVIENREFISHIGSYKDKSITVISTGIGTDNIDIVMNELDAVVNVDLKKRVPRQEKRKLDIVRIGTSGSIQSDIPLGTMVVSEYALGLDGLIYYYKYPFDNIESELMREIGLHLDLNPKLSAPYITSGSTRLIEQLGKEDMVKGITATASGFYGPQGRSIRLELGDDLLNQKLQSFKADEKRIINFEMESSALYGLGKLLGHNCCTCCVVLANRYRQEHAGNHDEMIDRLIKTVLDRLVNN